MGAEPPIDRAVASALGPGWRVRPLHASGFCETWRAERRGVAAFVKLLPLEQTDALEAEADGLAALAAAGGVRVPAVLACRRDADAGCAVLALEWLDLQGPDRGFGARLGAALAQLHAAPPPVGGGRFGWRRDNRLGATPQRNRWHADWTCFFAEERLGTLRERLVGSNVSAPLVDAVNRVIAALPSYFDDGHRPRASLIHGDLWAGNWGMLAGGTPVLYDPAVSCSDAEAELAMMELFGAPPPGFRDAYRAAAPLHDGYPRRRALYQLYHLLNHALLFGGGYASQALQLARRLAG